MAEPGNPVALLQSLVYGTGVPETMSESSELLMQCEEEELDPCQNVHDAGSEGNKSTASKNKSQSAGTLTTSPGAEVPAGVKNAALPVIGATATPGSQKSVAQVLQQVKIPPSMKPPQTIFLTSQAVPMPNAAGANIGKPIGFILNGQTYLTAAYYRNNTENGHTMPPKKTAENNMEEIRASLPAISPRLISPIQPRPLQLPVTLTISGPSGIQTVSALASAGVSQLNVTPSRVTPVSSTVVPTSQPPVPAAPPVAVREQPATPSPAPSPSPQPSPIAMGNNSATFTARSPSPPIPSPVPSPSPPCSSSFQLRVPASHSKAAQSCVRCKSPYKMIAALRGYMCMCNASLMRAVQRLEPTKRKLKRVVKSGNRSKKTGPSSLQESSSDDERHEGRVTPQDYDDGNKLIMLVEDFYYGMDRGSDIDKKEPGEAVTFKCHLCEKMLKNNLKMMVHTKHHVEQDQEYEAEMQTTCQHCFRIFTSPLNLQYHVESVHSQTESSTKCRICELAYENEPVFLQHMKSTHKPGEMPYICQVCGFRSSFYLDVMFHFRDIHSNTTALLCPYCLKVFRSSSNYQLHYSRHQKKSVVHCGKCRLQFLFAKDMEDHKIGHHITHRKPPQLEGLRPGTRVTIRTYAASPGPQQNQGSDSAPPRMTDMPVLPRTPEPQAFRQPTPTRATTPNVTMRSPKPLTPTRKSPISAKPTHMSPSSNLAPVPSPSPHPPPIHRKVASLNLLELMSRFDKESAFVTRGSCVECTFEIQSYDQHFPTYVHCALCRYSTCCSRSYANHMINNHVARKTGNLSKYLSMFRPCPREGRLKCLTCDYTTVVGDMMANHLIENPDHYGSSCPSKDGFSAGYKRFVFIPNEILQQGEVIRLDGQSIPSANLVALADGSADKRSPAPIPPVTAPVKRKIGRPRKHPIVPPKEPPKEPPKYLNETQLRTVLFALCCGVPQAAAQYKMEPAIIQTWLIECKNQGPNKGHRGLGPRAVDRLSEWVLEQREQQLPLNEEKLFDKAKECVGGSDLELSLNWAVDFLLQHELGVQIVGKTGRALPQSVEEGMRSFTQFISKQIGPLSFDLESVGAVDELALFLDPQQLMRPSTRSSAFRLADARAPLMDVVLSAMADGTLLPTIVFLRGSPPSSSVKIPSSVFLEARPEGFSNEERLELWLSKVWRPRIKPSTGGKGLLVMDSYRGHLDDDFLASLNSANTMPAVVPKACSYCLQPLEACTSPVLREFLQACWSEQLSLSSASILAAQPAELAVLMIGWLAQLLEVLGSRPDLLQKSFKVLSEPPVEEATAGERMEPTNLVHELTEALLKNNSKHRKRTEEELSPTTTRQKQKLRSMFEKDSDLESFHGFDESDVGK